MPGRRSAQQLRMSWLQAAILMLGLGLPLLTGCSAPAPQPPAQAEDLPVRTRPLKAYAADPFVPVNLYINANRPLPEDQLPLAEYLVGELAESRAFARTDRGVQRWPITLQLQYWRERDPSRSSLARRIASTLLFGLIPVHLETVHHLRAEVFLEPDPVGAFSYVARLDDRITSYEPPDPARDRLAINRLLERLLADIATHKLIPRMSAYKRVPPPSRARPREQKV